jgi:hypothetical protein
MGSPLEDRSARVAAGLVLTVLTVVLLAALVILLWGTGRGYDISDEAFYLFAASPGNRTNNANGIWGSYLGLVYRWSGFSLVNMRLIGMAMLVGSSLWFSARLSRLVGSLTERTVTATGRLAAALFAVSGALLYYGLGILTPSYNLLAMCSILICLAGAFGAVAMPARRSTSIGSAVAISAGAFVAFWCRSGAGVGLWIICVVLVLTVSLSGTDRRYRLGLVGAAVASLAAFAAAHAIFVLGPEATFSALLTARDFNFAGGFGKPLGELAADSLSGLLDVPGAVVHAAGPLPVLGLLPLGAVAVPGRSRAFAVACLASVGVVACGATLIYQGAFNGGPTSYTTVTPATLAIVVTAAISWLAAAWARRRVDPAGGLPKQARTAVAVLAAVLLLSEVLYAFTSNNALIGQTSGASVLGLTAAGLLLLAAVGRGWSAVALIALAAITPAAALASASGVVDQPYRGDGPLARADTLATVSARGSRVLLTHAQAKYFRDLVQPAEAAGFRRGTPLIDLTPFSPGASVALGAAAPRTLLYGFTTATARWVVEHQEGDQWKRAWLLVRTDAGATIAPESVTRALGRSFPSDYVLVTTAVWPFGNQHQQLWRPR